MGTHEPTRCRNDNDAVVTKIKKRASAIVDLTLGILVLCAGAVWKARDTLIDIAGGACLITAASLVAPAAGFAVAGIWLTVQAYGIERKGKT